MIVFDKLCRTTWSLRVHRTESVSVTGHVWSATVSSVSSTRSDQKQWNFFVYISLFRVVLLGKMQTGDDSTDRQREWCADVSKVA